MTKEERRDLGALKGETVINGRVWLRGMWIKLEARLKRSASFVWRNSPPGLPSPSGTPVGYYTFLRMDRSQSMGPGDREIPSLFRFLRTKSLRRTGRSHGNKRSRASMVKPHRVILISSILLDIQRSVRSDRDLGQGHGKRVLVQEQHFVPPNSQVMRLCSRRISSSAYPPPHSPVGSAASSRRAKNTLHRNLGSEDGDTQMCNTWCPSIQDGSILATKEKLMTSDESCVSWSQDDGQCPGPQSVDFWPTGGGRLAQISRFFLAA
ncbi:hypothetical protein HD553DRAFT_321168 [Filobasidium floriforme]|uniref:uncharacterized protein n=1 Tax=Filobasidium floriforme TaxID=5210 RepID=UPI001E8CC575|nr:uncharacterized protein HD553DRAFT_321168 [Filobasidium floriforme]KAH8090491.1 hypothetical protein HD553DRAFT_321168 [Filobasidium floriforme]